MFMNWTYTWYAQDDFNRSSQDGKKVCLPSAGKTENYMKIINIWFFSEIKKNLWQADVGILIEGEFFLISKVSEGEGFLKVQETNL